MSIYIELFHGHHTPEEELDDWGFLGPVIGPLPYFHITYGSHIKFGESIIINGVSYDDIISWDSNGFIPFLGAYYGDVCVFSKENFNEKTEVLQRLESTLKFFSVPESDLLCHIDSEDEWIRHYIKSKLNGEL